MASFVPSSWHGVAGVFVCHTPSPQKVTSCPVFSVVWFMGLTNQKNKSCKLFRLTAFCHANSCVSHLFCGFEELLWGCCNWNHSSRLSPAPCVFVACVDDLMHFRLQSVQKSSPSIPKKKIIFLCYTKHHHLKKRKTYTTKRRQTSPALEIRTVSRRSREWTSRNLQRE